MSNEERKGQALETEEISALEEEENRFSLPGMESIWDSELDEDVSDDLNEDDSDDLDDLGARRWEEFRDEDSREKEGEVNAISFSPKEKEDSQEEGDPEKAFREQEDRDGNEGTETLTEMTGLEEEEAQESQDPLDEKENENPDPENLEEADFEDRISMAMEKIIRDTMKDSERGDEEESAWEAADPSPMRRQNRTARPRQFSYVPLEEGEMQLPDMSPKKKHKGLKVAGITAAMLIVTAGTAYAGASYYYADKFFEGTTINGVDCSGMTPYEAEQAIASHVEDYSIQVTSRNLEPQSIDGSKIGYRYLSNGDILKLLKQQKPYEWISGFFSPASYTAAENITFDKKLLQSEILALNCAQDENQEEPQDAYVAFKDTSFEIVPETEGSKLDVRGAYRLLNEAISGKQQTMDFTSAPEAYVQAAVTSEDPDLKATLDACNNFTNASITYTFGDATETLDGKTIKDWLQFNEKGQFVQDDASFRQHIKDYVAQLAAAYDTVGTDRAFQTTSGRTVYVYGSAYGWKIDRDAEEAKLLQEIQSGTRIQREPVYSMTANSRGQNDLGNTYIEVDLSSQHMYYYQNGQIIFDSDIVSGNMSYSDRQTPPGIFTLYYKKSPDVLRGAQREDGTFEYEQPVTYWMPFNGGIGFHDASWQPYFGGDRYLYGGSHGCINLPYSSAAALYDIIQYGVPIICFY